MQEGPKGQKNRLFSSDGISFDLRSYSTNLLKSFSKILVIRMTINLSVENTTCVERMQYILQESLFLWSVNDHLQFSLLFHLFEPEKKQEWDDLKRVKDNRK